MIKFPKSIIQKSVYSKAFIKLARTIDILLYYIILYKKLILTMEQKNEMNGRKKIEIDTHMAQASLGP